MLKILVVDDQSIVRYGAALLIHEHFSDVKVDVAGDVNEMVTALLTTSYNVILLDINIPGGNDFGMLDIIRLRQPKVKILIFSGYPESIYARRYISEGAHGYLSKLSAEKELKVAINTVLQGKVYMSSSLKHELDTMQPGQTHTDDNPFHTLSDRELEVLNLLVVEGLGLMQISSRLNVQLSTVSTYKRRIFEKLNVGNIIELGEKARLYKLL